MRIKENDFHKKKLIGVKETVGLEVKRLTGPDNTQEVPPPSSNMWYSQVSGERAEVGRHRR